MRKHNDEWWAHCQSLGSIREAPTYAEWLETKYDQAPKRVEELEAAIEADQYHINDQEQVIEGLRGQVEELEKEVEYLVRWVQHDCPYSNEEIRQVMQRELKTSAGRASDGN